MRFRLSSLLVSFLAVCSITALLVQDRTAVIRKQRVEHAMKMLSVQQPEMTSLLFKQIYYSPLTWKDFDSEIIDTSRDGIVSR